MSLVFATTSATRKRLPRIERLARAMSEGVYGRLQDAAAPNVSMKLFNGLANHATDLSTATMNEDCWIHDLRSQLTGFHMMATNSYTQSFSATPLGGRFALNCRHAGPPVGTVVTYLKSDGTQFTTTIEHRILLDPVYIDFVVYVLADAVPSWVYVAPIIHFADEDLGDLGLLDPPGVHITQGKYKVNNAEHLNERYGRRNCPDNRMASPYRIAQSQFEHTDRYPDHHHSPVSGDSGTPGYALINSQLYLHGLAGAALIGPNIGHINSLIAAGATAAGISPITIAATEPPI